MKTISKQRDMAKEDLAVLQLHVRKIDDIKHNYDNLKQKYKELQEDTYLQKSLTSLSLLTAV